MQWILENREALSRVKEKDIKARPSPVPDQAQPPPPRTARGPVVAATVTIQTEEEKRLDKERRKEER